MGDTGWLLLVLASCGAFAVLAWLRITLPDSGRLSWAAKAIGATVSVGFVLVATLLPAGDGEEPEVRLDPTADLAEFQALGNIVLFVPLGGLLAMWRIPRLTGVIAGVSLSGIVELLQFLFVDGRYAATGDVILNALGTVVGYVVFSPRSPGAERPV